MKKVLITGVSGFIGSNLADALLAKGYQVAGIDDFNDHYDPFIKRNNISDALRSPGFTLYEGDINDHRMIHEIIGKEKPDTVVHIAGLTGMLYSMETPELFLIKNMDGTASVLEACRQQNIKNFIFTSSSSVYGNISGYPDENTPLPEPLNPYVLSKKLAEEVSESYARLHHLNVTILRFSTVYGPRQRRTQAISKFTHQIDNNEKVTIFGNGLAVRNYLNIEDCVEAFCKAISISKPYEVYNIGNPSFVSVTQSVDYIAALLKKAPDIEYIDHPEVVPVTSGINIIKAERNLDFKPLVSFETGIAKFIDWYKSTKIN